MYELAITRRFAAAHQLREYRGKCENIHGHTFKVEIRVRARKLDRIGLAIDFRELKEIADRVLAGYDHQLLNELPEFRKQNPSSENLARSIYRRMQGELRGTGATMSEVTVWESEDSAATYRPGQPNP